MALDPLNSFFSNFKKITLPNETVRKKIHSFILKNIGVDISLKNIIIKNKIIYIKTKPVIKNEIFIKKEEILLFLKKETEKDFFDIR